MEKIAKRIRIHEVLVFSISSVFVFLLSGLPASHEETNLLGILSVSVPLLIYGVLTSRIYLNRIRRGYKYAALSGVYFAFMSSLIIFTGLVTLMGQEADFNTLLFISVMAADSTLFDLIYSAPLLAIHFALLHKYLTSLGMGRANTARPC